MFSIFDCMHMAGGYKDSGASARKEFGRMTKDGAEFKEEVELLLPQIYWKWAERDSLRDYPRVAENFNDHGE